MNIRGANAIRLATRWSNPRGLISRPYGSKCGDSILRTAGLNSVSFPRGRAPAARFITGKRLSSSIPMKQSKDVNNLPEPLRRLPDTCLPKALAEWKSGYVVLAPNSEEVNSYLKFGPFHLRENCQCPKCIHPETKQRMIEIDSIPSNIKPTKIHCGAIEEGANITWSDGHESLYAWPWLERHQTHSFTRRSPAIDLEDCKPRKYRTFDPTKSDPYPEASFEKVMSNDSYVGDWLDKIQTYGFCFIKGVPIDPEATKSLIERIAHVRHTHYGGFWDFTADLTFKDTAYTNESLGVHTDNTYFTDPARLQLFHLLSHTDGSGGESLLVDGFEAASELLKKYPKHYQTLTQIKHPWHSSGNEDVCIQPSFMMPVFSIHPDEGVLYQIRWNNYDRAPKSDWSLKNQKRWYEAAQCYDSILNDHRRKIQTQLQPGTALIFDNWRMMHGRTEFTGKRRMCGGYVNNDDYISRLRLLKYGRDEVLHQLGCPRYYHKAGLETSGPYSII